MAIQQYGFQGINRAISDYSADGACEELINLRPTTGGLVPVKPFSVKMSGLTIYPIYTHYVTGGVCYIGLDKTSGTLYRIGDSGDILQTLKSNIRYSDGIHFAATGNIALFSICNEEHNYYENFAFVWDETEEEYTLLEADIPYISAETQETEVALKRYSAESYSSSSPSRETVIERINIGLNAIQEQNKEYCFGAIIIAIAFKTKDNKTFWTNRWLVYDPTKSAMGVSDYYLTSNPWSTTQWDDFFNTYGGGFESSIATVNGNHFVRAVGTKVKLVIDQISGWNKETSILRSIEVYASRPRLYADPSVLYGDTKAGSSNSIMTLLPRVPLESMELDNQLLYLQGTIALEDLLAGDQEVELTFGGNIQLTNKTLLVDAGAVTRYGEILSYNNRFHFYNSVAKRTFHGPMVTYDTAATAVLSVFLRFSEGSKDKLYCTGDYEMPYNGVTNEIVIVPFTNVTELIVYGFVTRYGYVLRKYAMTPSQRYNYSICVNGPYDTTQPSTWIQEYEDMIAAGGTDFTYIKEPNTINVTEQYNPFVFKVEHSYLAPGKIIDVKPQLVAVPDVNYGDYPLNVFTDRGVFALLQGSGNILYGNFHPVSNLLSEKNSVSTESGTFLIAAGGLWVVAGNSAVLVSDALSRGPHTFLRQNNPQYNAISHGAYDISGLESNISFENFVAGASLSYNRFRDELIISNPSYDYSYVLSLKYRQWFKIAGYFEQGTVGSSISAMNRTHSRIMAGIHAEMPAVDAFNFLHSENEGSVEIEITTQGSSGEEIFSVEHYTQEDEHDDPELWIQRVCDRWNDGYCGERISAAPLIETSSGSTTYRIKFTFLETILDIDDVYGNVTYFHTNGDLMKSEHFDFSEPPVDIVDFSKEEEGTTALVHLQSRPFSVAGFQYAHIHRLISMLRTSIPDGKRIVLALYGSDDLQGWTLISYASRTGTVNISQLRTPSAARSWRYYTITIGGELPTDSDMGPFFVDYQPVIRRIG